jgi:hypothetical protein
VVLGRPSQTDPLARVVSGHRVLGSVGIADWAGSGLAASDVASDLVVVSSVHSESCSRILAERARVTSTHRSIPKGVDKLRLRCPSSEKSNSLTFVLQRFFFVPANLCLKAN